VDRCITNSSLSQFLSCHTGVFFLNPRSLLVFCWAIYPSDTPGARNYNDINHHRLSRFATHSCRYPTYFYLQTLRLGPGFTKSMKNLRLLEFFMVFFNGSYLNVWRATRRVKSKVSFQIAWLSHVLSAPCSRVWCSLWLQASRVPVLSPLWLSWHRFYNKKMDEYQRLWILWTDW
jgi:hypothetical protein